tara:strand:- start:20440 stop:20820 length:381 start_codon:yes stop_codon:yes gene_type:complete
LESKQRINQPLVKEFRTHQSNRTENIDIKCSTPLLWTTIRNLLHWIQRPVIYNQTIQSAPSVIRQLDRFLSKTKVGEVAGEDFDALGAVLVVQLVERGVGSRYKDEFVVAGKEVVGYCEADAWWEC